jgi:lipopolysaccharide export system permease protein
MKILRNYLLIEFFKSLITSLISLSLFYIIVDFISNVGGFTKHSPQFQYIILYFVFKSPEIIYRVLPLSVLLSTMLVIIAFNKNNEIIAIKSSGVSMLKFAYPLIISAICISIFAFILFNFIAVRTNIERRIIMQKYINKNKTYSIKSIYKYKTKNISLHYKKFIITAKTLDPSKNILRNVNIYQFNNKFKLIERYSAKWGYFSSYDLKLYNVQINIFRIKNHYFFFEKNISIKKLPIKLNLDFFKSYTLKSEFLSIFNLAKMFNVAKKSQSNISYVETYFYSKFAFPLINLILVLIGIAVGLSVGKKGGTSAAIGISIAFAFGYWTINSIAVSLGITSQLNPILAAFMADITFLLLAIYLVADID